MPRSAHARQLERASDKDLVALTRDGSRDAYGELWRRHAAAGRTVARSYTSRFDPDDLVAEAFARILRAIDTGGGPTGAFRAYLFTTIRHTAAGWARSNPETPIEDADAIEDPEFSEESTLAALDRSLTASAFRTLPTRWQEALWYSEVEGMTPQEIAPILGMKANAAAALTYRAREGLRQAWIQAHINSVPADSECRWTIDRIGAYTRRSLTKRNHERVDAHLGECSKCAIIASEARDVGSRIALVLLPLAAGLAGATGYAAWLQQGGAHASAATAMPAAFVWKAGGSGYATAGGPASTTGHLGGAAAASSTPAAAGGASQAAGNASGASSAAGSATGASSAAGAAVSTATIAVGVLVAAAVAIAAVVAVRTAMPALTDRSTAVSPAPHLTAPAPANTGTGPASTGTSTAQTPSAVAPDTVPVSAAPSSAPATTSETAPPPATSSPATPPPSDPPDGSGQPPVLSAPAITAIDTAGAAGGDAGPYFPVVSGTASPGTTVTITQNGSSLASVTTDSSGAWATAQLSNAAASGSLQAVQADGTGASSPASAPVAYSSASPTLTLTATSATIGGPFDGDVDLTLTSGSWSQTFSVSTGTWLFSPTLLALIGDGFTAQVRYADEAGRYGPTQAESFPGTGLGSGTGGTGGTGGDSGSGTGNGSDAGGTGDGSGTGAGGTGDGSSG